jgi:hypothetical protein
MQRKAEVAASRKSGAKLSQVGEGVGVVGEECATGHTGTGRSLVVYGSLSPEDLAIQARVAAFVKMLDSALLALTAQPRISLQVTTSTKS